jgi:hypothetical protein
MTEQEGYRKLAKDLEYLYIAENKRKARTWFHRHKENMPQRLEDYNAGVMAERDRIINLLLNQKCEDENCMDCDTTNFHIEIIKKGENPSVWEAPLEKRQDD